MKRASLQSLTLILLFVTAGLYLPAILKISNDAFATCGIFYSTKQGGVEEIDNTLGGLANFQYPQP